MEQPLNHQKTSGEWILELKNTHLFRNIADDELVKVAQFTKIEFFEPETVIFHEGDPGEKIYFQLDGYSTLFLGSAEAPTILTDGKAGDCFGEMSVIDNEPRSASLKTIDPTHFLTIDQVNFEKLLTVGNSRFSINLMHFLSQRLRHTDTLLIQMLQKKNVKLEETLSLLKTTQDELLRKERLSTLGRMASMIVHDLRNPLTSISSIGYVLTHQDLSKDQRGKYGKMMNDEIHRLVDLIEEILLFAKEKSSLHLESVDLKELLHEMPKKLEKVTPNEVAWTIEVDTENTVTLDQNRIQRALLNLCKNACEAFLVSKVENPTILLKAVDEESTIKFTVHDNGPGISEEIKDSLFDAFVSSGKPQGTGLGLAIVKKVAEDHQGKILVESSAALGTQFNLIIPKRALSQESGSTGA